MHEQITNPSTSSAEPVVYTDRLNALREVGRIPQTLDSSVGTISAKIEPNTTPETPVAGELGGVGIAQAVEAPTADTGVPRRRASKGRLLLRSSSR